MEGIAKALLSKIRITAPPRGEPKPAVRANPAGFGGLTAPSHGPIRGKMMGFVVRHTGTFIDLAIGTRCDAVDLVWYSTYSYTATAPKAGSGG